jgi:N-dimethylarginine dimethylaminohydrolase
MTKEKTPATPPLESPMDETLNPTSLNKPAYLLNVPFSLSASVANNAWMREIATKERTIDVKKAINQFMQVYHFIAAEALVYLLPTPHNDGLQDLVYTANMGIVLHHLADRHTVVLSNFSTQVRTPETGIGCEFFKQMGYHAVTPPYHFEGEAELKHLYDNIYLGGYGIRSQRKAYTWMEEQFDMQIIPLKETDPYLYHLDCTVFPLTRENTLVCTEMYSKKEIREIETHTNIINVSADDCYSGVCNSVRLGNTLMSASNIHEMKTTTPYYAEELHKNRTLEDIAANNGFELSLFNLSEYFKSGALLSCMVMHLNRQSYDLVLL